ncbi:hypothetical protein [Marinobacter zhejiangensis]|uniref:Uncharacterized protein n=1 Tax=Marinobacter zhejiangensis TaxID=488535 RepID=A0A1I4T4G6_9GAMM|nr:hypothetical protein [Marinobacter zhejiangensis]SFM71525.1 hypothetical protein SAMN04487963_3490 [Marinobacter zhejiangensis]
MEADRIYFKDNPWPEGHPIKEFEWSAKEVDGDVWFDLHLKSADYYSERDIEDDEDVDYPSSWDAPNVWGNYHACTLSSNKWHNGGFRVCAKADYSPEFLDGLELLVDPDPDAHEDWDDFAFHIYLLGHDAAARHRIRFDRIDGTDRFRITWLGAIALAYVGDHEFKHEFSAQVSSAPLPSLPETNPVGATTP